MWQNKQQSKQQSLFSVFWPLIILTISFALTGCGRLDNKSGDQEMAIGTLSSDISALYADVQALKSEQGLIYEQLEAQNAAREEVSSSSSEEQKRLQALANKGSETRVQLEVLSQKSTVQGVQIEQLRGDIMNLKKGVETLAKAMSSDGLISQETYLVQPGDTLEKIARRANCTIEDLRKVNQLTSDLIVAGKQLKLPTSR